MHVTVIEAPLTGMTIHPSQESQILALIQNETLTKVPSKYKDYADLFLFNLAIELPKNTGIKKHAIKLQDDNQLLYGLIYSLRPLKLEILKTYIETHLKTGFIRPFKSHAGAFILFDKKPISSFQFYVNY